MASVMCLHFSMQEEGILEHAKVDEANVDTSNFVE